MIIVFVESDGLDRARNVITFEWRIYNGEKKNAFPFNLLKFALKSEVKMYPQKKSDFFSH